jgi:hypothetical protein
VDWSIIEMNESNSLRRVLLPGLAIRPVGCLLKCKVWGRNPIEQSIAQSGSHTPGRLMDSVYCLSLWFSLPLAIWLSSGWIGLLAHWQAISAAVCIFQRSEPEPAIELPGNPCLNRNA